MIFGIIFTIVMSVLVPTIAVLGYWKRIPVHPRNLGVLPDLEHEKFRAD